MKNNIFKLFKVVIGVVLFGKVLSWVLHFNDPVNHLLNTAMFCLIGLAYLVVGYSWDNKIASLVIVACGLFLLVMNILPRNVILYITGIVSIIIPMLIARFSDNSSNKKVING